MTVDDRKTIYEQLLRGWQTAYDAYVNNIPVYRLNELVQSILCSDNYGICNGLVHMLKISGNSVREFLNDIPENWPELYSFKPENLTTDDYWFTSMTERINVLQKCIKLCELKLKKHV